MGRAVVHENLGLRFATVSRQIARYYAAVLADSNLNISEHGLLHVLKHWQGSKPESMTHLAARTGLEDSATRKALYRLQARRLVEVVEAGRKIQLQPDGRAKPVALTQTGRRLVDGLEKRLRRAQLDLGQMLTTPVLATFYQALRRLQHALPHHTEAWIKAGDGLPAVFKPVGGQQATPKPRYRPLLSAVGSPRRVSAASRRRQRARLTR